MALDPVSAVSDATKAIVQLVSQVFGFAVDPDGYSKMSRDNKLKVIHEAIRQAINANDGPALDQLFNELRDLRKGLVA